MKKKKIESLIYFLHRLNCHMQGKALHNGRMFRRHFAVKTKQNKSGSCNSYTHFIKFF